MPTRSGKAGDCGVDKYVFNADVARRRLHGAIVATVLIVVITFLVQWLR
jgi:hypothetical protein